MRLVWFQFLGASSTGGMERKSRCAERLLSTLKTGLERRLCEPISEDGGNVVGVKRAA
jgi:hypothetical protein